MALLVRDPGRGVLTPVEKCKVCNGSVYRSLDRRGKQAKFNVGEFFEPTREQHVCAGRVGSSPRSGLRSAPASTDASPTSGVASLPNDQPEPDHAAD